MDAPAPPPRLRFDAFELDGPNARLTCDGTPVPLAPKAFAVLCALAGRSGQLVTKSALLDSVWGHRHVSDSVLKTTVSQLRAALGDDAKQPRYIETASRRGYRFLPTVRPLAGVAAVPDRAFYAQQIARLAGELRQLITAARVAGIDVAAPA